MPRLTAPRIAVLLAVLATVAAYARVLDGSFQFDDGLSITQNPMVKNLDDFLWGGFDAELLTAGRPVTTLTFALNYHFARLTPWPYHATNLAIHVAAVLLAFALARRVLRLAGAARPDAIAAAVAALFALHPLQSEAVAYIVQRSESMASALYLATLVLLLVAEEQGFRGGRAAAAWGGAVVAFAVALLTKAIVVTAPVAYLLLVAIVPSPESRRRMAPWGRRAAALAPLVAMALGFATLTLRGLRGVRTAGFSTGISWSYPLTEIRAVTTYLRLLVWPSGQSADWDFPPTYTPADPALPGAVAVLVLVAAAAVALSWRGRRKEGEGPAAARVAGFGLAWFFLVLSPTSSVVPLLDPIAEHRVYLASWGVFLAAAAGGERLGARLRSRWAGWATAGVAAALCAAFGVASWVRAGVWESPLSLWSDVAAKAPLHARAHHGVGYALGTSGDIEGAIREYKLALELARDRYAFYRMPLLTELGAAYILAHRYQEAASVLEVGVRENPQNASMANNLALARLRLGDLDAAYQHALRATQLDPSRADPYNTLAEIMIRKGQPALGLQYIDTAIRLDPDRPVRFLARGVALADLGRVDEACRTFAQLFNRNDQVGRDARGMATRYGCGPR